jgi:hypothetical protein
MVVPVFLDWVLCCLDDAPFFQSETRKPIPLTPKPKLQYNASTTSERVWINVSQHTNKGTVATGGQSTSGAAAESRVVMVEVKEGGAGLLERRDFVQHRQWQMQDHAEI